MLLRATPLTILIAVVWAPAWGQEASNVCSDGRIIKITSQWDRLGTTMSEPELAAQPLRYSISSTQGVQGAWIEVWDRPKRLSRKAVAIVPKGEADCGGCQDAQQTPEELYISIFDPGAPPEFCIDYCPAGPPARGEYVSELLVGKRPVEEADESDEPAYLLNDPELTGAQIRIEEGSGSTNVVLSGENLIASSRVFLLSGEDASPGNKAPGDYLYSRTLDFGHVEVTVPSYFLKKAGLLTAYAKDSWDRKQPAATETGQKIIVASKESPVILSVEPKRLKGDGLDATVTLRGSGFTEHSEVKYGDEISLSPGVTFVSPNQLRVEIRSDELVVGGYARPTPVTLWVTNGPFDVSAPVEIRVTPTAQHKRQPLTAQIRAIVPYPIPMMDSRSPARLTLEIEGDNFRPNDVVFIGRGDRSRLKTQYVSPHHLRAWMPREPWRKHRLSFRLVVRTFAGVCAAEASAQSLE
jgi:hypothetical protein